MNLNSAIVEDAIAMTELMLGISVTVIDNQGSFHTPAGMVLFPLARQTHQKNPVCNIGFSHQCIEHCRYAMKDKCDHNSGGFFETCWKGITEIVIPIRRGEELLGIFYAGSWRRKDSVAPQHLPRVFYSAFAALPEWNDSTGEHLLIVLRLVVDGIVRRLEALEYSPSPDLTRDSLIRAFIRQHATDPVGINELSAYLGLSRSSTSRLLQENFKCGLVNLLQEERIRRAQTLLTGTADTVASIAVKVGFNDEYYFNKVFRKKVGIPPGQFRNRAVLTSEAEK
jgi:AraC-like DNA-binding protein